MKINIVMGFFLPMPPIAGGATEKSWDGLAREFAARGHEVTILSRTWPKWPLVEQVAGVRHLRFPGFDHTSNLARNLWCDLRWSLRIWRTLPPADLTIVNAVALPALLGYFPRKSGRLVLMPGRVPKGQFRLYRRADRVLAVSSVVRDLVLRENPALDSVTKVHGYPISWRELSQARRAASPREIVTIGYIGRLNREKGLDLLAAALALLAGRADLPPWRAVFCGPDDVARGGSGPEYVATLRQKLSQTLPANRYSIQPPLFNSEELAALYASLDVFCYPSLAARGETFGVAVAEAMAAGAVPVVSHLPCFSDFVRHGQNGLVFDHTGADAPARLADSLAELVRDAPRRTRLAVAAQAETQHYGYPEFAERLLADFSTLK